MRKLASVEKIKSISPIDGADAIELAQIRGWQVVVKKGEFQVGDYVVYFEIDSFLPINSRFEFLRSSCYKNSPLLGEGFLVQTKKLRGVISQGLCLPASEFPELWEDPIEGMNCIVPSEGQDVTYRLGVRKWEVPERATTGGTICGTLPWWIPKSNEIRIQNCEEVLDEFKDLQYYISTKMDGSSHAIGIDENDEFYVCGHNYRFKDDGSSSFYNFVKKKGFEKELRTIKRMKGLKQIAIVGEYCGAGIQQNRLKLTEPHWYVFSVYYNGCLIPLKNAEYDAQFIKADFVPIEEYGESLKQRYGTIERLLRRADGEYPNGGPKEGIVIRPIKPVYSPTLGKDLSFKVINNRYLVKHKL